MFHPHFGQHVLNDLRRFCSELNPGRSLKVEHKADNTPVTEIDRALSDFCKRHSSAQGFHFYSEEEHGSLQFPALVVDPLDGTREFIAGRPECAVSMAWLPGPRLSEGFGLVYNPFTGFALHTQDTASWTPARCTDEPTGMLSRSEWEKNLHQGKGLALIPRGSIAFKLALLASGTCDYVVSFRPKSIWDIAGGTLLCQQRGFEFWAGGRPVTELSQETYPAPLIWARPGVMAYVASRLSL